MTSGKIYSKSGQYSINFDDPTGAKIYDEVGGFVANEGGLFPVGGFGMVDDNMIFMINATAGKNGGQVRTKMTCLSMKCVLSYGILPGEKLSL